MIEGMSRDISVIIEQSRLRILATCCILLLTSDRKSFICRVILAHEGRLLEAILKVERGVASRGCGSQLQAREVRGPARQALRPGCEELAARIRRKCRRRKRGPRPKIATVERREASVPGTLRDAGRLASARPAA